MTQGTSSNTLMILLLVAFMAYLMWSQYRQRKRTNDMLKSLGEGDDVVTVGGIFGTIEHIEDDVLTLKVADGVVVRVAKAAVSGKIEHASTPEDEQ